MLKHQEDVWGWVRETLPFTLAMTGIYTCIAALDVATTMAGLSQTLAVEGNPYVDTATLRNSVGWRELFILIAFVTVNLAVWPLRRQLPWCDPAQPLPNIFRFFYDGIWGARPPYWRWLKGDISFKELIAISWHLNLPFNLAVLISAPAVIILARLAAGINNMIVLIWPDSQWLEFTHALIAEIFWFQEGGWALGYLLFSISFVVLILFPIAWYLTMSLCRRANRLSQPKQAKASLPT